MPSPSTHTAAERLRLIARLRRRYELVEKDLEIGPVRLRFARIADPDRVLDQVAAEEDRLQRQTGRRLDGDALHLPYWAELWDSASGLADFLVQHLAPPGRGAADLSVLDLGCGMGLSGTVAAALGARVLLADLEPPALLFARLNAMAFASPRRPQPVRTRQLNWQRDRLDERFDVILGADILYERKQWEFLEPFWRAHLAPAGRVLLGEPGRQTGELFIPWIASRGWTLTQHEQPVSTRPRPIRIFSLTI